MLLTMLTTTTHITAHRPHPTKVAMLLLVLIMMTCTPGTAQGITPTGMTRNPVPVTEMIPTGMICTPDPAPGMIPTRMTGTQDPAPGMNPTGMTRNPVPVAEMIPTGVICYPTPAAGMTPANDQTAPGADHQPVQTTALSLLGRDLSQRNATSSPEGITCY